MVSNITIEKVDYFNQPDCLKISNGKIELIATTNIGPRVICYRFLNKENILGELTADNKLETEFGVWHAWGGHRLWHAPEINPRSYVPDDLPVGYEIAAESIKITPKVELHTGIQKEILIEIDPLSTKVILTHTLTNRNVWSVKLAPWALTIMNAGGETIIPNEPFISHDDYLLPARPMAVWHFTNMSDPRWTFGEKFIRLKTDEKLEEPQKIGVSDRQGWAGYLKQDVLFIKKFPYVEGAEYPDYGCNCETYTAGNFMELESLGPLSIIEPGCSVVHVEEWYLFENVNAGSSDDELASALDPILKTIDL